MAQLSIISERKPDTSSLLPLDEYDRVIVSFSGGKDSLACVLKIIKLGVPLDKIELWHQHIDGEPGSYNLMDWPVTHAYCKAVAEALGLTIRFQWKQGGFEREMLRKKAKTAPTSFQLLDGSIGTAGGVRGNLSTRQKFPQVSPDLSVRWCSAYLKIDVAAIAMNNDPELEDKTILFITGERRAESPSRSRYAEIEAHRCSRNSRRVDHWRNVIDLSEQEVWSTIREFRIVPHPAYRLGFGRLSCMKCIFANEDQWASIRVLDPKGFFKIAKYEKSFGTTIQRKKSVVEQADAGTPYPQLADKELVALSLGHNYPVSLVFAENEWELPAGAFKKHSGPN